MNARAARLNARAARRSGITGRGRRGSMRALVINCTLKPSPQASNTEALAGTVITALRGHGVQVEAVRAVDLNIKPESRRTWARATTGRTCTRRCWRPRSWSSPHRPGSAAPHRSHSASSSGWTPCSARATTRNAPSPTTRSPGCWSPGTRTAPTTSSARSAARSGHRLHDPRPGVDLLAPRPRPGARLPGRRPRPRLVGFDRPRHGLQPGPCGAGARRDAAARSALLIPARPARKDVRAAPGARCPGPWEPGAPRDPRAPGLSSRRS